MISVVMSYLNRREHLINTLRSMTKSACRDFEVIVTDDGSSPRHNIDDLPDQFSFLKVSRINPWDKKHTNPCIATNISIGQARGDIVIIQNPECFHYHDVLYHVQKNISDNKYLAYTTINRDLVAPFSRMDWDNFNTEKARVLDVNFDVGPPENEWYCHEKFRPEAFNFCTAITKRDMDELKGFDERFAYGVAYDDAEFLERVRRKGMEIVFVNDILVVHQSHGGCTYAYPNVKMLMEKNRQIYNSLYLCEY